MDLLYLLNETEVGTKNGFCAATAEIWGLVGRVVMVMRIVFPILVIIWGIIDVGKSVTSSKPEEITKAFKSLAYRLGAAVAIFFIPSIVSFGIRLANGFKTVDPDYQICADCLVHPKDATKCPDDGAISSTDRNVGTKGQ